VKPDSAAAVACPKLWRVLRLFLACPCSVEFFGRRRCFAALARCPCPVKLFGRLLALSCRGLSVAWPLFHAAWRQMASPVSWALGRLSRTAGPILPRQRVCPAPGRTVRSTSRRAEISVHPGLPALRQTVRSVGCRRFLALLAAKLQYDASISASYSGRRVWQRPGCHPCPRTLGRLSRSASRAPGQLFGRLSRHSVDFLGLAETDRTAPRQIVRLHSFWHALAKLPVLDSLASSFVYCAHCCHLRPCLASFSVAAGN
jgi:hypothetical protein